MLVWLQMMYQVLLRYLVIEIALKNWSLMGYGVYRVMMRTVTSLGKPPWTQAAVRRHDLTVVLVGGHRPPALILV